MRFVSIAIRESTGEVKAATSPDQQESKFSEEPFLAGEDTCCPVGGLKSRYIFSALASACANTNCHARFIPC